MIDFRYLPPRTSYAYESVEENEHAAETAPQFFTDPLRPPNTGAYYWDADYNWWLPRISVSQPIWQEKESPAVPPSNRSYTQPTQRYSYTYTGNLRIPVIVDPEHPEDVVTIRTGINLTGRKDSPILEGTPQSDQPEETVVPNIGIVLSRQEAEAAYKRASAALAKIDELEQKYAADMPDGSVIAFRLLFPGIPHGFSYCAIRAAGQWFSSGRISDSHTAGTGVDWSVLLEAFEKFQATNFEVLRCGGDERELTADPINAVVKGSLEDDEFEDDAE